ncbi:hypothetical protein QCE73_37300 [Caballeronia sp. LZ029]|uniref:hypothetical protein n=1 Tax=Caballeronia sp. LZ029 TaxID=3038564 RepID=UPI002863B2C9|nr:hypothetical protein [Caballeronia sp. LZ029]MDR5748839.1 hypothetical protein [Caballeronia sp. LZ029]
MSRIASHHLCHCATSVSTLRNRLLRGTRMMRSAQSASIASRVSQNLPQQLLAEDLLNVLGEPLRAIAAEPEPDDTTASRTHAGEVHACGAEAIGHTLQSPAEERGRPPDRALGLAPLANTRLPQPHGSDGSRSVPVQRPTIDVARGARQARCKLAAAIDTYWLQVVAAEPAPAGRAATTNREQGECAVPSRGHADERRMLSPDRLARRLFEFERSGALPETDRSWASTRTLGALRADDGEIRSVAVSAGGEPVERSDDLAERIADLLRDQAVAHGIDLT